MDFRAISIILVLTFLLFSAATALNINKLLAKYSDYSNLNDLLTKTNLAGEINSRSTITILALDNGAVSSLSSQPIDVARRILSVHVILDYYDSQKLKKLSSDNATVLPTLFQASGGAVNQQGFIKVEKDTNGDVSFGSNVRGASADSKLVKSVITEPYTISVLQISSPIQVPGIETRPKTNGTAPPPANAFSPKKSPSPSADTPSKADAPVAKSPKTDAPTAKSPKADTDSPVNSPPKPDADSPSAADGGNADAAAPGAGDDSSASRGSCIGAAAVMAMITLFLAL